ncbi:unnamed protein product [Caenorhabditis angaria]|uniref:DNA mismatch repair protein S5 domain-containing protein n=1 Tax=Caenorhabditis angaria TaxID=860376 RepID=A0A9P1IG11_9PELO|nr:unnamed protein product [Caenorhabditis angaria]
MTTAKIQRLPRDVINRMAAGEVLARPGNAIKELVENSLDAGATEIMVHVQNCGLKMLQVCDNGKGINREDFELVCERFATSKLATFEDLQHMRTYGFRGEALASLSHVARVNIVSRQIEQSCAYQADFLDGKMLATSKPAAGKTGTCITAHDLFHNLPQRKNKILSHSEESRFIFEILMKFAVHRPDVSFALRQNHSTDFRTKGDGNFQNVVNLLVGNDVANNLIGLNLDSQRLKFQFSGCMAMPISAATAKMSQARKIRQNFFSVFVNGRSVRCDILKQPMDEVLAPKNLICQFCAVDLKIDETRVDVNVHPTKDSVLFLEKEEIVEEIKEYLQRIVDDYFKESTENQNPAENLEISAKTMKSIEAVRRQSSSNSENFRVEKIGAERKRVDYMEIRNDSKERKLDEFIIKCPKNAEKSEILTDSHILTENSTENAENLDFTLNFSQESTIFDENESLEDFEEEDEDLDENRRIFDFTSLVELKQQIEDEKCLSLSEMFKTFNFVGFLDPENLLIQFGTSLYLLKFAEILKSYFYQSIIENFGNFASFRLENPLEIGEILSENELETILEENCELLEDYFALKFEKSAENRWILTEIPEICANFVPQLEKLPEFLKNLAENVDFHAEMPCFRDLARVFAQFFVVETRFLAEDGNGVSGFCELGWREQMRRILGKIKRNLVPNEQMKEHIIQLADSHDLYKVFERCGG